MCAVKPIKNHMPSLGFPYISAVENEKIPLWTDLLQASNVCIELVKCGCKKGCTGRCKCSTSDLKCTELCQCFGRCTNGKSS